MDIFDYHVPVFIVVAFGAVAIVITVLYLMWRDGIFSNQEPVQEEKTPRPAPPQPMSPQRTIEIIGNAGDYTAIVTTDRGQKEYKSSYGHAWYCYPSGEYLDDSDYLSDAVRRKKWGV